MKYGYNCIFKDKLHHIKNIEDIPKESNIEELTLLLAINLNTPLYKNIPGKLCGNKVNHLLELWGFKEKTIEYEIY